MLKHSDTGLDDTGSDNYVIVGRIGAPFGVDGFLKIHSETQPTDNLLHYRPWYIESNSGWKVCEIVDAKMHGKIIIAKFPECHDRETARRYTQKHIAILRSQLPTLPPQEYYWADLTGLTVINENNEVLGTVDHLLEVGSHDVLVIKNQDKEILIPFVMDRYIKSVDLDKGEIHVIWDPSSL